MEIARSFVKIYGHGILMSYAQIFFSNNKLLGFLLLAATFIDIQTGAIGLLAIILTQVFASIFNYSKEYIKDGSYTFNVLLVGLMIGVYYQITLSSILLLGFAILLTLFITLWLASSLGKQSLPYLSIPFLLVVWLILLGAGNFSALILKTREVYSISSLSSQNTGWLSLLENSISEFGLPSLFTIFLKSLGAIFFQYNILAGIIVAIGILINSRMAFILAFLGFYIGYGFYEMFEGDFSQLIYSHIGFNYILSAIALGGFFIVPSRKSFLLVLIMIPIIALLNSALYSLFSQFGLPIYSLSFNIIVILSLIALRLRVKSNGLDFVINQQYSIEKNHYKHFNQLERFKSQSLVNIYLPFIGEWNIPQGYAGGITHKGEWSEALDFDVRNESGKSYKEPGNELRDYFCYDLPVVAPADGWVTEIKDGIDDNEIGDTDLSENWGNTIIIKHAENIYSKLSHLRKDTFKVNIGEYVKQGDIIGYCGSSGRSPEPHLHFQMQETPFIGSKTLSYPIAHYITKKDGHTKFHSFEIPKENELVSNIQRTKILENAFNLLPGKKLIWKLEGEEIEWEINTDALGYSYIYCNKTGSKAYFINNKTIFYFTDFSGDNGSLLHLFYLACQKVVLGYYEDIVWKDKLLIQGLFPLYTTVVHDITAPFFHYLKADFEASFSFIDDKHHPEKIKLSSKARTSYFGQTKEAFNFEIEFNKKGFQQIEINYQNKTLVAKCPE